ncbi:hypothetical protein BD770DRAFT_384911 [Pilaira anomala]|nr:hypothetical protein BD770DRAFT_384911 [Pilaira anomala]
MDVDPRGFAYTSIVVSSLLTLFASFFFLKSSKNQTVVGASVILATLFFLVINIFPFVGVYAAPTYILHSLYVIFTYLPIIFVSRRIIKHGDDRYSKILVNLGFVLWPLLYFSITIAAATLEDDDLPLIDLNVIRLIYALSEWTLVWTTWIALVMVSTRLSKKSRGSMIAFAMFFSYPAVAEIAHIRILRMMYSGFTIAAYFFELVSIIGVIVILTVYGSNWVEDSVYPTINDVESRSNNGLVDTGVAEESNKNEINI